MTLEEMTQAQVRVLAGDRVHVQVAGRGLGELRGFFREDSGTVAACIAYGAGVSRQSEVVIRHPASVELVG